MSKNPMYLKFLNREITVLEMLQSFSRSKDSYTSNAAVEATENPPDLEEFRKEFNDALTDVVKDGLGEEFKAFVNHYMESTLEEDVETKKSQRGENVYRTARVKNKSGPWIQGVICYNLCLYIRAFGLSDLKMCKVCDKFFAHKGKYALYCSDVCKANKSKAK
jgi:hypothetical protein